MWFSANVDLVVLFCDIVETFFLTSVYGVPAQYTVYTGRLTVAWLYKTVLVRTLRVIYGRDLRGSTLDLAGALICLSAKQFFRAKVAVGDL